MKKYKLALIGATGIVGRETLKILHERNFPTAELHLLASSNSVGTLLDFGGKHLVVEPLNSFDFSGIDLAIFCVPSEIAAKYVWKATAKGAIAIDNSTYYRTDPDVPVIIPEVNADAIKLVKRKGIIANSNCAAIQMLLAVKPLHDFAKAKRIVVSTYQSVSGWGKFAMDELYDQSVALFKRQEVKIQHLYRRIAFNVIPQIDKFMDDGASVEEWKIRHDTGKILDKKIKVSATCVRVPVLKGHSEAINIEFARPISPEKAREILAKAPGVQVTDDYLTPAEAENKDAVFVSRIRKDDTVKNGLSLWVVSDNIRKGAALNTVQIAEELAKRKLI